MVKTIGDKSCHSNFDKTIIRFLFFLSYLITIVLKCFQDNETQKLRLYKFYQHFPLIGRVLEKMNLKFKITQFPYFKTFYYILLSNFSIKIPFALHSKFVMLCQIIHVPSAVISHFPYPF